MPVRFIHFLLAALIICCQAAYGLHAAEVMDSGHVHNAAECIVCFAEGNTGPSAVPASCDLASADTSPLPVSAEVLPAGLPFRTHPIRGPPVIR